VSIIQRIWHAQTAGQGPRIQTETLPIQRWDLDECLCPELDLTQIKIGR
jgi:hypothetical protein